MKKFRYMLLMMIFLFSISLLMAQVDRCGTTEYMNWLMQQDPELEMKIQKMNEQTGQIVLDDPDYLSAETITVIPCVVHVVWNTSQQNISDQMVESQIEILNEDFRRMQGTNGWNTHPDGDDTKYEWRLATVDPDGEPTNGITRTFTTVSSFGTNNAVKYTASGGHDAWPSDKYCNIWVCNLSGGLLGYAQFPNGNPETDGVVILYSAFGRNSPAFPYHMGRTTTHELGHWLWLYHTFQNGCTPPGDYCDDTPYVDNPNFGCPTGHMSCGTLDMIENYMDYTDDLCMNIFTMDQDDRMDVAVNNWRSDMLVSYKETIQISAINTDYTFTDVNGNPFGKLNFSNMGTVDTVTIEVWPEYYPPTQPEGTKAVKRFFDIDAHGGTGFSATLTLYYDDSEVIGFVNGDSYLELFRYDGANWLQMGGTVNTAENSVALANVSEFSIWAMSDPNDNPIPVELNLFSSIVEGNQVRLTWTTVTETNNHGFEVERSVINESSWQKIGFVQSKGTTTEPQVYSYTDIDLLPGDYQYRLKIVDNDGTFEYSKIINSVVEPPAQFSLSQNFPNPFNPSTTISFQIPVTGQVKLKVFDTLGNEVATIVDGMMEAGIHELEFNAAGITSGVYIYTLISGEFSQSQKMLLLK
jgi:hypothetical protein